MTDTVVAEGQVKFRDGKKWKTRWVVLRKPSPVADCLSLLVYKEKRKSKDKEKSQYHKERLNVKIEAICGLEPGPGYDGVSYSLSILCLTYSVALGFSSREAASAWEARIRYSLGEVHRFSVQVQPGTKLEIGPASLHLCNTLLVLTRDVPPLVIGHWKLSELRRYGAVPDGFVFEGGSRCGIWSGVFYLSSAEGEQISFHLDCIARGVSPGRAQRGPRPPMPGDPTPCSSEERMNQEELELEKRLSLLSQSSRPCSMASTYSCSTVAGDDHSSISSSSSSQSDSSYGSRLLVWAEPTATWSRLSTETVSSSSSTLKALLTGSDGVLYNAAAGAAPRPSSSNQLAAHGLQDSGRQNSLDSGIGVASSGSSASYAGSLDAASQGGAEDFGSAGSLPLAASRPTSPLQPALLPPPSSLPPPPAPPLRPPVGPASRPSTADSGAFARLADEYHVPGGAPRPCYDTPRSLLQGLGPRGPQAQGGPPVTGRDRRGGGGPGQGPRDSPAELSLLWGRAPARPAVPHSSHSWAGERAPSVDGAGRCGGRRLLFSGRPVCGGPQCAHTTPDNYIIPELWRGCGGEGRTQASNYFPPELLPSAGCRSTSAACSDGASTAGRRQGETGGSDGLIKLLMDPQRSLPYLAPSLRTGPPKAPCSYQMPTAGVFHRPPEVILSPSLERRFLSTANYVNVPMSPAVAESRRALLNMELRLNTPGPYPASRPPSAPRGDFVARYPHLDMAAMERGQEEMMLAYGQQRDARLSLMGDQRGALT